MCEIDDDVCGVCGDIHYQYHFLEFTRSEKMSSVRTRRDIYVSSAAHCRARPPCRACAPSVTSPMRPTRGLLISTSLRRSSVACLCTDEECREQCEQTEQLPTHQTSAYAIGVSLIALGISCGHMEYYVIRQGHPSLRFPLYDQ